MTRQEFLNLVEQTVCGNREQAHGNPTGTFKRIAALWSVYLGLNLTPSDIAHLMILFKIARLMGNAKHNDSLIDIAGYAACASEINDASDN